MKIHFMLIGTLTLSGCGTAAFKPPAWTIAQSTTSVTDVGTFLRGHVTTYDRMIDDLETGKSLLEFPIIPAAVIGATGVALGASTDLPIVLSGGAAGLSATSSHLRPRDRLLLVVQARAAAVCVSTQFSDQVRSAANAGYLNILTSGYQALEPAPSTETEQSKVLRETTNKEIAYNNAKAVGIAQAVAVTDAVSELGAAHMEVFDVGGIAVNASEEIVTRLKMRLANVGSAPEYGAIVTQLRTKFETAEKNSQQAILALADGTSDTKAAQIAHISQYSARVAECLTKIP